METLSYGSNQKKIETIFTKLLVVFLIIQPLLDVNILFDKSVFSVFGLAIPTFIRLIFVVVFICLYSIIWYKVDRFELRKHKKKLIATVLVFILYIFLHHFVASTYLAEFSKLFPYSLAKDLVYFAKMMIPIVLLFLFFRFDIRKYLTIIVVSWIILTAGSIVITNLLGISLSSYTNEVIKGSIFTWNKGIYEEWSFLQAASKGFFRFANEVSAIMSMLVPFATYYALKNKSLYYSILLFVLELGMLMIGTKVALFSFIILFFVTVVLYFVVDIVIHKSKIRFQPFLISIFILSFFIGIYPNTPSVRRSLSTNQVIENAENAEALINSKQQIEEPSDASDIVVIKPPENSSVPQSLPDTDSVPEETEVPINPLFLERVPHPTVPIKSSTITLDEMYVYIENTFPTKQINSRFPLTVYPYNIDPEFWYETLQLDPSLTMNNRFMEDSILSRVKDVNNNKFEFLSGMGYSRMHSLYPLEQDFIAHFYTIGIIGIALFLGQYFLVFILGAHLLIKRKLLDIKTESMLVYLSLGYIVMISIYSGNVIDSLFTPLLVMALIAMMVADFNDLKNKSNSEVSQNNNVAHNHNKGEK